MAATEVAVAAALEADSICTTEIRHNGRELPLTSPKMLGTEFQESAEAAAREEAAVPGVCWCTIQYPK